MKTKDTPTNKLSFSAVIEFEDDNTNDTIDIKLDKDIGSLTYDEVEEAICNEVDQKYGFSIEDFEDDEPYRIVDLVINEDGESYPVVPEDADLKTLDKELDVKKYLVLPWARYSLTPECKLWMKMKKNGFVGEDEPFDFETYHKLVEGISEKK